MMAQSEDMQRDLEEILGSGVTHTGQVMELLRARGWPDSLIVPVVYRLLLKGLLDPNGNKAPYKGN